jgi:cellulose synthase operon protein C
MSLSLPRLSVLSLATLLGVISLAPTLQGTVQAAEATTLAQTQNVPIEVRRGYTQLAQNLVNQAIATFQRAIERYPTSIEAKLGLAIAYRRAGRDGDAFTAYKKVLEQDSKNLLALRSIGVLGGFKSEWQPQGIEALTQLLEITPNDLEARAQRALLYGYQGKFPESLSDYEIVLREGKASAEVLLGAAQIYTYSGNPQRGLELFEQYQTVSKRPVGSNAAIAYARALRETGRVDQAVRVLEGQLPKQTNAFGVQVRSELAQAYLANRQPTQALATLDPLRGRSDSQLPLARALNEIGRQAGRADLQAEAANLYQQVLQKTPNPPPTLLKEVADVLSGIRGQEATALNLYRQLVQQDPNDRALIIQQLALESRLGTMSQAEVKQRLRAALQPLPSDIAQQTAIAQALVRLEPDPELFPVYQTLLQAGVNEPFLNFRLAQLLIDQGNYAGARAALATYRSTPAGAQDLSTELLLADIERREGNLEVAAQRYQALIARGTPESDLVQGAIKGLAGIRLSQNRTQEALFFYDQLLARNPNDWSVRLGRTAIAYQAKLITEFEADAVINQFLASRPASTPQELYALVGLLPARDYREGLYTALVAANPSNIDIQVRLIQILARRNPYQAQVLANRLLAQVRDGNVVSALFLRGRLAEALGNLRQADEAYLAVLRLQPENLDAISALGGVRFQARQFDSAARLYNLALALQPSNTGIQRTLADLSAAAGKPLEALDRLEWLRMQQLATQGSVPDPTLERRMRQLQEDMLQQRGFQPPWERY